MTAWGTLFIEADNLQDALEAAYRIEQQANALGNAVTVPDYDFDAPVSKSGREWSIPIKFVAPKCIHRNAIMGHAADQVSVAAADPKLMRLPGRLVLTLWNNVTE